MLRHVIRYYFAIVVICRRFVDGFKTTRLNIQDTNNTTMKLSAYQAIAISTLFLIPALSLQAQNRADKIEPPSTSPDIYLRADAGAVYMQDLQVNVASMEQFKFNTGTRFDLAVGSRFSRSWSAELECGVIWNSIDKYGDDSFSAGNNADLYQIPVMVNYMYRLPIKGSFEGFLGAGIGFVVGIFHVKEGGLDFKNSDTTFGYQVVAGLNYHLSRQVDLSLAYKFLGTSNHKWSDDNFYTKTEGSLTHAVTLGVSFKYY